MEAQLNKLLEKAKQNKKAFLKLKELAVECQQYELAVNLRGIERELFPESDEVTQAKEFSKKLNLLFRMVDLNIPPKEAWLIVETFKKYTEIGGDKFGMQDATDLTIKTDRIFNN